MNRRRLDAEGLRDAMLVVSGELNLKAGGPGVLVPIEKEVEDLIFTEAEVVDLWPETPTRSNTSGGRSTSSASGTSATRCSTPSTRPTPSRPAPSGRSAPTPCKPSSCSTATSPPVGPRPWRAGSSAKSKGGDVERIDLAYELVLGRDPRPKELDQARSFLASQADLLRQQAEAGQPLARPTFTVAGIEPPMLPPPGSTSPWRC